MIALEHRTPLHLPKLHVFERDGVSYAVDAERPNWVAVDARARELLDTVASADGPLTAGDLVARHAARHGVEAGAAWLHVHDFLTDLNRAGMLSDTPWVAEPYPGRADVIAPDGLRELWIQVNNACNLECSHCLVSSGPGKEPGLPDEQLVKLVDRASALGLERLYLTGGEPFVYKGLARLITHATADLGLEVIVLTNGTVFQGAVRRDLETLDRERVRFQISIDGAKPETSDAIRGKGTFTKALDGARLLSDLGFPVSLATVVAQQNLPELAALPALVESVGATSYHLMWAHRRGRAAASRNGFFPKVPELVAGLDASLAAAESHQVELDNVEAVKRRVNGVPGVKYDLGNGGWDSLAVFVDGKVYPTAALVSEPRLLCGDLETQDLGEILETSPVVQSRAGRSLPLLHGRGRLGARLLAHRRPAGRRPLLSDCHVSRRARHDRPGPREAGAGECALGL
jgi:MoaA/NifB/PqqE/SkfB family radical SAM enzyme